MSEKCQTCKFFGNVLFLDRMPNGQCRRKAPAEYEVQEKKQVGLGPLLLAIGPVKSPFPGVWPEDFCGEYQPKVNNECHNDPDIPSDFSIIDYP